MCDIHKLSGDIYHFDGFSFYHSVEESNYWEYHEHKEIQIILPQNNAEAWMHYTSSTGKLYHQRIKAGQPFLLAPHLSHALEWKTTAEITLFFICPNFVRSLFADITNTEIIKIELNSCFLIDNILVQELSSIFRQLYFNESTVNPVYIISLIDLLVVYLVQNHFNFDCKINNQNRGLSQKKLELVFDFVEANIANKINLSDLAKLTENSKFYFCRLFKKSLGISPYQYILKQRVLKAKKLLKDTDLPICDIALECGFSNQSHLTKHFHSTIGKSPSKYRQEV